MIHEFLGETGYGSEPAEINYSMNKDSVQVDIKEEKDSSTPAEAAEDTTAEASSPAKVVEVPTPAKAAGDPTPAQIADT